MRTEFSESTFAQLYTHEVISICRLGMSKAPEIPTLRAEERSGYDLSLEVEGWFYFAQFKAPAYLTRASAKQWGYYKTEYFRFEVGRLGDTHQHDALTTLALRSGSYLVEYVAPRFYRRIDLDSAFGSTLLIDRSLRLRVTEVQPKSLASPVQTYVTYQVAGDPTCWSDPFEVTGAYHFGDLREPRVEAPSVPFQDETYSRVYQDLLSLFPRRAPSIDGALENLPVLVKAQFAARLLLDATIILIPANVESAPQ